MAASLCEDGDSPPLSQETYKCLENELNSNHAVDSTISQILNAGCDIEPPVLEESSPKCDLRTGSSLESVELNDVLEVANNLVSSTSEIDYMSLNFPTSSNQSAVPIHKTVRNLNFLQSLHCSIPPSGDWPGDYDFNISFGPQEKIRKSTKWTYSEAKEKLYINLDVPVPIRIHVNKPPPVESIIRAMPVFSNTEHITDVVKRCFSHSHPNDPYNEAPEHLIKCDNNNVQYVEDPHTGRQSVKAKCETPQAGTDYSTFIYRFMCLGSCVGGLNRRPIKVIFTLENGDKCLGRKIIEVRICACPGRDRKLEEKRTMKRDYSNIDTEKFIEQVPPKKSKFSSGDNEYIIIRIHQQHYDQIKKILDGLEILDMRTTEQSSILRQKQLQRTMVRRVSSDTLDEKTEEIYTKLNNYEPYNKPSSNNTCYSKNDLVKRNSDSDDEIVTNKGEILPIKDDLIKMNSDSSDEDVANWLLSCGMIAYIDKFKKSGYKTMALVKNMTEKDLLKLKIGNDHTKKIWESLSKYKISF